MSGRLVRLILVALPLYFGWEMLQAPAFTGMPHEWLAATGVCALATLGDAVIVLVLFGVGAVTFRETQWFLPPRPGRYAVVVGVGVVVQVGVEWAMVHGFGRWGYASVQPVIPWLEVGVVPVLQPVVLLPLVFAAAAFWEERIRRRGAARSAQSTAAA